MRTARMSGQRDDELDLDQELRQRQPGHACDRLRGRLGSAYRLGHRSPDRLVLVWLCRVDGRLDDVVPAGTELVERTPQVLHHLPRLRSEVSLADDRAVRAESGLTG